MSTTKKNQLKKVMQLAWHTTRKKKHTEALRKQTS